MSLFLNNKPRIIIHIPLVRRDSGIGMLFKRMFEKKDCDVLLSSGANLMFNIKYWKPHSVIIGSMAPAKS